jgi:hypothetical protein
LASVFVHDANFSHADAVVDAKLSSRQGWPPSPAPHTVRMGTNLKSMLATVPTAGNVRKPEPGGYSSSCDSSVISRSP